MGTTIKACNCAECGVELRSVWRGGSPIDTEVAGRIKGRPYCCSCLRPHRPPEKPARPDDGPGPWQDLAIRLLEDG